MATAADVREQLDARIGAAVRCPICGGSDWETDERFAVIPTQSPDSLTAAWRDEETSDEGSGAHFALVLVCGACAFVRLHAVAPEAIETS